MKRPKMRITLQPSNKMTELAIDDIEEHSRVRLPRAARLNYQALGTTIEIINSDGNIRKLSICKAFIDDMSEASDKKTIGFVTNSTYNEIVGEVQSTTGSAWISESLDNLVVGSDPEFGLIDSNGDFLYAADTLTNHHDTAFGTDGPCMELRPKESDKIDTHISNIKRLLKHGTKLKTVNNYKWWTGASYKSPNQERKFTLGGHIHIGNPKVLEEFSSKITDNNPYGTTPLYSIHRKIIRVLDELIAVPLTRIDGPDAAYRRNMTHHYGAFGDFRSQIGRFEWRTPSAVWLSHPNLARAVIGTAKAVSEESYRILVDKRFSKRVLSGLPSSKGSLLGYFNCLEDYQVRSLLHNSTKKVLDDSGLARVHNILKSMSTYPKYREYIDEFILFTSLSEEQSDKIKFDSLKEHWLENKPLTE